MTVTDHSYFLRTMQLITNHYIQTHLHTKLTSYNGSATLLSSEEQTQKGSLVFIWTCIVLIITHSRWSDGLELTA